MTFPTPIQGVQIGLALLVLVLCGGRSAALNAADLALDPGEYKLVTRMMMPHLEEMRRIVKRHNQCLEGGDPAELFPVLRQPALRGCFLGYAVERAGRTDYVLQCESARVATGTAQLVRTNARIDGVLEVKMGGKNMTFSQHSTAVRLGACTTADTQPH